MISAKRLSERLATEKTSPSVRMIALMFGLVNIPGLIAGTVFFYVLPLSIWGIILYVYYWLIFADKVSSAVSEKVWKLTMLYNCLLILIFLGFTGGEAWPISLFNLAAIGFAFVALREGREAGKEKKEAEK
ncbi:MAG: hypothetical protein D6730_22265 [Bacteroidetes bacterium]|nr:MAG: hypothetical protein D6730_22265 [Bacteroidota bacterium]